MSDTANPSPGERVDAVIEEARQTVQEIRAEVQDMVSQFGQAAVAKLTELVQQLDQKLDEVGAMIDGDGKPLT